MYMSNLGGNCLNTSKILNDYHTSREISDTFNAKHPDKNINYLFMQNKYRIIHGRNVTSNEDNDLSIVLLVIEDAKMWCLLCRNNKV